MEPTSINISSIHETSAIITWTNSAAGEYTYNAITVRGGNGTIHHTQNVTAGDEKYLNLTDLKGGTMYNVSIRAAVSGSFSIPKEKTFYTGIVQ